MFLHMDSLMSLGKGAFFARNFLHEKIITLKKSFLLRPDTKLHGRRRSKMTSLSVSKFTAAYQFYWSEMFPDTKLLYPPTFDCRCVLYPSLQLVSEGLNFLDF